MKRITFYKNNESVSFLTAKPVTVIFCDYFTDIYYTPYGNPACHKKLTEGDGWTYEVTEPTIEDIKSIICDNYCKFPHFSSNEELQKCCETCPLDQLGEKE